jgi:solute carrier family 25 protein 39/40
MDVVRNSAQAAMTQRQPLPGFRESLQAARQDGASGLFRGAPWAIARACIAPTVFLAAYEHQKYSKKQALDAALVARGVQAVVLQPLDLFKTMRQSTAVLPEDKCLHLFRGPWDVITAEGMQKFWRAGIPTLLRDVPFSAGFYCGYAATSHALDEMGAAPSATTACGIGCGLAGLLAFMTQPMDVVKTRMQTLQMVTYQKSGFAKMTHPKVIRTVKEVFAIGGLRAFWSGGTARVVKLSGAGLIMGPVFEFVVMVMDDASRPMRYVLDLPDDPVHTIVHPRQMKAMGSIEVAGFDPGR